MKIILSYPWWFTLFCIAGGFLFSLMLYYKNKKISHLDKRIIYTLFSLRFVSSSLLLFFLLSPFVKNIFTTIEKPHIVFLKDNSSSLQLTKDSLIYQSVLKNKIQQLESTPSDDYQVSSYLFDGAVQEKGDWNFKGKQTDIASAFEDISVRYINRNLRAVVLITDGIYNKGTNPLYVTSGLHAPVYCVALGDTSIQKDVYIKDVRYNQVVFLGNDFPIEVMVNAGKYKGKQTELKITVNGTLTLTKKINITSDDFSVQLNDILLNAAAVGTLKVKLALTPLGDETTVLNNTRDLYIEVIDSRQKILFLSESPHPDIGAIQQTLSAHKNFQPEIQLVSSFSGSVQPYSLIILHQLPTSSSNAEKIINAAKSQKIPVLFMLTNTTNIASFNLQQSGISIEGNRGNTDEIQPVFNSGFTLFSLSEKAQQFIKKLPPLVSPYGSSIEASPAFSSLFYRKIGSVATQMPFVGFANVDGWKTGVITGEGIWKWRLHDFMNHQSHEIFDEIIIKSIQYLAVKEDKSFFRVNTMPQFWENEPVVLDAELYNESYELINTPDVSLEIVSTDKRSFSYTFSKKGNSYRTYAGRLPVGEYKYTATVNFSGKKYVKSGNFVVKPIQLESVQLRANHQLLNNIAYESGGKLISPSEIDQLMNIITSDKEFTGKSYSQKQLKDLIELKWIFFLIVVLLSVEWLIRKQQGMM